MEGSIFIMQLDNSLVKVNHTPYNSEALLQVPPNAIDVWPSIGMSAIATEDGLAQFLDTFAWYVDTIRAS